jgi:hypothetical protein
MLPDLLAFDTMITPKLITWIYYLLLLIVLLTGLSAMFNGGFLGLVGGLLGIIVGALWVRVSCELMIVFFKMNESLQEIRKK